MYSLIGYIPTLFARVMSNIVVTFCFVDGALGREAAVVLAKVNVVSRSPKSSSIVGETSFQTVSWILELFSLFQKKGLSFLEVPFLI